MNNIQGINNYGGPNAIPPTGSREAGAAPEPVTPADEAAQVEISSVGRYLQKIAMLPDIRAEKVEEVRQGLAQGTYDVEDKLPAALDNFLDEYHPP